VIFALCEQPSKRTPSGDINASCLTCPIVGSTRLELGAIFCNQRVTERDELVDRVIYYVDVDQIR